MADAPTNLGSTSREAAGATPAARWGAGIAGVVLALVATFFFVIDSLEVWHPFIAAAIVAAAGSVLCLAIATGRVGRHKSIDN